MQIQRIENNNYSSPSFGIKINKIECQKVLGNLSPNIKKQLNMGINLFCDITQRNGVKGTFTPIEVMSNKLGDTILKYKIIDLHNNAGDRIFKALTSRSRGAKKPKSKNFITTEDKITINYIDRGECEYKALVDRLLSNVRKQLSKI